MCNQCIEQCVFIPLYLWVLLEMGFLAQYSLLWLFLDLMVRREITRKSFEGWWCSDLGLENLRLWMLVCLDHLISDWAQAARPWTVVLWCRICSF